MGMRHILGATVLTLFVCLGCSGGSTAKSPQAAAGLVQLATLEARPLHFPPLGEGGVCPYTSSEARPYLGGVPALLFGTAPVWGEGGPESDGSKGRYYHSTFYTDPSVRGPVLIRGGFDGTDVPLVFAGDYTAGPVAFRDAVAGKLLDAHTEAVLPAGQAPKNSAAVPGWGIWPVQLGMPSWAHGCIVLQVDTQAGSEEIGIGEVPL